MASLAHALHLAAPIAGKVANFSFTVSTGVDLNTALGAGAMSAGGYIDLRFTGDCYVAFGQTGASLTATGVSAGWFVPANERVTWEYPTTSGFQYLFCSAVTGTVQGYAMKSSFEDNAQYRLYCVGGRKTVL